VFSFSACFSCFILLMEGTTSCGSVFEVCIMTWSTEHNDWWPNEHQLSAAFCWCVQHSIDGVLWSSHGWHSLKTCCLWAWSCPTYSEVGNWVCSSSQRHLSWSRLLSTEGLARDMEPDPTGGNPGPRNPGLFRQCL